MLFVKAQAKIFSKTTFCVLNPSGPDIHSSSGGDVNNSLPNEIARAAGLENRSTSSDFAQRSAHNFHNRPAFVVFRETSSNHQTPHRRLAFIIMGIFEDIKENNITDLKLSVPADEVADDIHEMFKVLGENKSIETVDLSEDFIGDLRPDTRIELLVALGTIPTLKEVHLADGLLMIESVGKMVMNAKSLRALTLKNIILQGTEDHFKACEAAFHQHAALKEFEMADCDAAVRGITLEGLEKAGKKRGTGSIADPVHNVQSATTA